MAYPSRAANDVPCDSSLRAGRWALHVRLARLQDETIRLRRLADAAMADGDAHAAAAYEEGAILAEDQAGRARLALDPPPGVETITTQWRRLCTRPRAPAPPPHGDRRMTTRRQTP